MSARPFLLAVFGVAVLIGPSGTWQAPAQEASYPEWFRSMPQPEDNLWAEGSLWPEGSLWAVGYARGYRSLEVGMDSAKADAYERLRRNRRAMLEGEKLYESAPGFRQSLEGARFAERGLPDTLRQVTYLDSAQAGGMTLVLAAWSQAGGAPESFPRPPAGRQEFPSDPPSWVLSGPGDDGKPKNGGVPGSVAERARAVGRAPRYYYLHNSWQEAEAQARRQLAFQAVSKVEQLEKRAEGWRHAVTAIKTGAYLRDVQALARWADEETCYVLVEGTVRGALAGE